MKLPFTWAFLFLSMYSFSQNLLANSDFEDENICTEYTVNCAPEAWVTNKDGFSTFINDSTRACRGKRFLAIEVGHTSKIFQRTFYRTRLLCGLRKDHQYRLEFFVKSPYDVLDSMGVIFTSFDFLFGKKRLHNLAPSLFFQAPVGSFSKDSSWQKVSMIYQAAGDEAFLSLANFSRRDIRNETPNAAGGHFFVFIDDISLTPLDLHEQPCPETEANRQEAYEQDERHEFLRLKIRQNNDDPPPVKLSSTRMIMIDTLILPDMLFASGKAALHKNIYGVLDNFFAALAGKKIDSIVVEGHTDNRGTPATNEKLSADRARAVKEAIRKKTALSKLTIITRGWAHRRPVANNNTASGRQRNRRVELFVYANE